MIGSGRPSLFRRLCDVGMFGKIFGKLTVGWRAKRPPVEMLLDDMESLLKFCGYLVYPFRDMHMVGSGFNMPSPIGAVAFTAMAASDGVRVRITMMREVSVGERDLCGLIARANETVGTERFAGRFDYDADGRQVFFECRATCAEIECDHRRCCADLLLCARKAMERYGGVFLSGDGEGGMCGQKL